MDTETPNALVPREFAIIHIARIVAQLRADIDARLDEPTTPDTYFESRARVFAEQTIVELRRAAEYLRTTDMADDA